jgi:hypothetical protein
MWSRKIFIASTAVLGALVALAASTSTGTLSATAFPARTSLPVCTYLTEASDRVSVTDSLDFKKDVHPFIEKYCAGCHSGAQPPAGIDLTKYATEASVKKNATVWGKVADILQAAQMPPVGSPQPEPAERSAITGWIQSAVSKSGCLINDPGRITLRRLNREEYNNTVRDLLGVDLHPADEFPSDDVGYGFDNIGDVLSMSPLLLEKYLSAAEKLAQAAIIAPEQLDQTIRFEPNTIIGCPQSAPFPDGVNLFSNGEVGVDYQFPEDGEYVLRVRAYGEQAGKDPARMALRLDHADLKTVDVRQDKDLPGVFDFKTHVTAGVHRFGAAFLNDYYDANAPDPKERDRNLIVMRMAIEGPISMPSKLPESERRIITRWPTSTVDRDSCAREIMRRFATRAFRRPVTQAELDKLVKLTHRASSEGASFQRSVQLAIEAVLVSPSFLFHVEIDPPSAKSPHPISNYELASRLSYFLWSTMPDDELFKVAANGTLSKPSVLQAQVRRMLQSPKAHALATNFAGQWLQLRKLAIVAPDPQHFPDFNESLRTAMRTETEMYFDYVASHDRPILDFLDSDYTFMNEQLARHYGYAGVSGPAFRLVHLTDHTRGGVLTQASVLTVTSNPTRTSPVKRGKWVLEEIFGTPPPPPPPGVPQLDDQRHGPLVGTMRQRLEMHRANPACANCHARLDPLGFGLENFDGVGRWRTHDGDAPVDASGNLPDGATFNGPAQLKGILMARKQQFVHAISEKMLIYALGRGLETNDRCSVDTIAKQVTAKGYHFSALVDAVVDSKPFLERRGEKGVVQ